MKKQLKQLLHKLNKLLFLFYSLITKFIIFKENVRLKKSIKIIGIPHINNNGRFEINDNVKIISSFSRNPIGGNNFCSFWIKSGGKIIISEGARISNSSFVSQSEIFIGKDVFIGGNCKIYDTDFHSIELSKRLEKKDINIKTKPIKIENGVFVGAHSIILKGVNIGSNSVIGAGSVVTKDIPENEIWAGNPAKFIKKSISD